MTEELLHYVWMHAKFPQIGLRTVDGLEVSIIYSGQPNAFGGPDFLFAQVRIDGQHWVGNVEIHLKSSDWLAHGHQHDIHYDNVVLHVVYKHDREVLNSKGQSMPTLALSSYLPVSLLNQYRVLMRPKPFINCENQIADYAQDFIRTQWIERLLVERLQHKSEQVEQLLVRTCGNWEQVLFLMLLKGFGTKVNGDAFIENGLQLPFRLVQKYQNAPIPFSALLFGSFGMLEKFIPKDAYYTTLQHEYHFLKHKHELSFSPAKIEFFGLRPVNFPSLRLAQFIYWYSALDRKIESMLNTPIFTQLRATFSKVEMDSYWGTHYVFGKTSTFRSKKISQSFIDLLMVNVILPVQWAYHNNFGEKDAEWVFEQMRQLPSEKNTILKRFASLGWKSSDGAESQALLHLYKEYCNRNKCLQCAIGAGVLDRNPYF